MRPDERKRRDQIRAVLAHLVDAGELFTAAEVTDSGERFRQSEGAVEGEKGGSE